MGVFFYIIYIGWNWFKGFLRFFSFVFVSDYLQGRTKGSTVYGFRGGPAGIMKGNYVELSTEFIYPYRNQVEALIGLSVIVP